MSEKGIRNPEQENTWQEKFPRPVDDQTVQAIGSVAIKGAQKK